MHQQTAEFREALGAIRGVKTFEYDETVLRDRRMLSAGLLVRDALYVRDRETGLGSAPFSELEFEPDAARLQGATDSQHGVVFGDLHTYVNTSRVVVKCYETTTRAAAVREYVAYEFMKKAGFESFTPLGIVAHQGKAFLMTVEEPSLRTFNNMHWSPAALKLKGYGEDRIALLAQAGSELGAWHAQGTTHGDARPKNVALSERGKVGFIDFESLIHDPSGIGGSVMIKRQADDLLSFYGVLRRAHGYCNGMDTKGRYEQFSRHFLEPFTDSFQSHSPELSSEKIGRTLAALRVNLMKYILVEQDLALAS